MALLFKSEIFIKITTLIENGNILLYLYIIVDMQKQILNSLSMQCL
jgi:hypothetical protein